MDLQFFINIILRRKWIILASMLVAAAAAYWFVNQQERSYKAGAIITTGVIGAQGLDPSRELPFFQKYQVEMSVANIIEFIQSRANVNLLSYRLLLHDLDRSEQRPFRQPKVNEENPIQYSQTQIDELTVAMQSKVDSLLPYLYDPQLEMVYKDLATAYEYDYLSILENMAIGRKNQDSDLLGIEFISENPQLSAFVVNTFVDIILSNHRDLQRRKDTDMVNFYTEMSDAKEQEIINKETTLRNFKTNKNLVDLDNQKQATVTQIKDLELQKEAEIQKIQALEQNREQLAKYLSETTKDGNKKEQRLMTSESIERLNTQIKELNDRWIASGLKDEKVRIQLDATKRQLREQLALYADARKGKDIDVDNSESNILIKKIDAELELNFANEAILSIDKELNRLQAKTVALVSDDAYIRNLETEIELLQDEYKGLINELNKATINLNSVTNQLNLLEHAQLPEKPEPSKKMLISAFSAIVAGTLCTLIIFLLAYFDTSFSTPDQFQKFTSLGLLGTLNAVKPDQLDLQQLFNSNGQIKKLDYFKEALRNMRFNIENSKASTFLFTSSKQEEGKSFLMINLAQSFRVKNKRVLLLDTNFKHNSLTQMSSECTELNLDIQKLIVDHNLADIFGQRQLDNIYNVEKIDLIANTGNYLSPSEIFAGKDFHTFLDKLTLYYDYVFFEAPAMNKYSDAKELSEYADRVVAVFSAESDLRAEDKESLSFIQSLGNKFMGAVLNKLDLKNLA